MQDILEELKKQATVRVHSHGAFGESESYERLDPDKFAKLIVEACAGICYRSRFEDGEVMAQYILFEFNIDNCRSDP